MNDFRQHIETKARDFRRKNGLGETIPVEFRSLLLDLNILTLFKPLSDDFSGMCLKDFENKYRFMLINSNHPMGRQHFTIAHELYHLYYDTDFSPHKCNPGLSVKSKSEKHADAFAAALLMPETGLRDMIYKSENESVNMAVVLKLEQYYRVSRKALLVRLKDLNLITKAKSDELSGYSPLKTAREYGYETSLYNSANNGLVIGDYGETARLLFDKEKISEGHYLELLSMIYPENATE